MPVLSWKFLRYLESFRLLISVTFSQVSHIEKAVAFETSQLEFLQATKAFLLSILWIFPASINLSRAL